MKIVARAVAALALLSFATPALPCAGHETTTAKTEKTAKRSTAVAKSGAKEKKAAAPAKTSGESRPATAAN